MEVAMGHRIFITGLLMAAIIVIGALFCNAGLLQAKEQSSTVNISQRLSEIVANQVIIIKKLETVERELNKVKIRVTT